MVVGIAAENDETAEKAYQKFLELMEQKQQKNASSCKTITEAKRADARLNLATISVAGEYAAQEGHERAQAGHARVHVL